MATFKNKATLSYTGNVVKSNVVTGEIIEIFSGTKTATKANYTIGEEVSYFVTLKNSSSTDIPNVTVEDNLGELDYSGTKVYPLTYVPNTVVMLSNGVITTAPTVAATQPLRFSNITIPANGNISLHYTTKVNEFADPTTGGTIENTAIAEAPRPSSPVTVTASIVVADAPKLSVVKALTPTSVPEDGEITYTFTIQNYGNIEADDTFDVFIEDQFKPTLTLTEVKLGTTNWVLNTDYTYVSGLFKSELSKIIVPAATAVKDPTTHEWIITPGSVVLTIKGTV